MGCGASTSPHAGSGSRSSRIHSTSPGGASGSVPQIATRPLMGFKPYRHGAPISLNELNQQRLDFWSTRTEGNAQMWQAIRSAAEAILAHDVPLANAIMEASNITTPNGTLEVCYDERGVQYKVPQYCYANPVELTSSNSSGASGSSANAPDGSRPTSSSVRSMGNNTLSDLSIHTTSLTADPSPRSDAHSGSPLKLRLRINPGDYNVTIPCATSFTIQHLKEALAEAAPKQHQALEGITVDRQRIFYMGKEMTNNKAKLGEAKFDEVKVVQVFLRPARK